MASLLGTQSSESSMSAGSSQRIPKFQQKALNKVYKSAAGMMDSQTKNVNAVMPQVQAQIADIIGKQGQSFDALKTGGSYSNIDPNSLLGKIEAFQNTPSQSTGLYESIMGGKGNNYVDAMKDTLLKDAQRRRDLSTASLDAGLAKGGMSGGSRHGVAQSLIDRDINDDLSKNMTKVGYESFDKDLQNKLGIARLADEQMTTRQGMFTDTANMAMQGKDANINRAANMTPQMTQTAMSQFAPAMMPWKNLQNYSAAIGNPTVLTDSFQNGSSYSGK